MIGGEEGGVLDSLSSSSGVSSGQQNAARHIYRHENVMPGYDAVSTRSRREQREVYP